MILILSIWKWGLERVTAQDQKPAVLQIPGPVVLTAALYHLI